MNSKWDLLLRKLNTVYDLKEIASLLAWDQQTMMPPNGTIARSQKLATIEHVTHKLLTDPEIGSLLDTLRDEAHQLDPKSKNASLWRITDRHYQRAMKVPSELVTQIASCSSEAFGSWVKARADDDFGQFKPYLERQISLQRKQAEALGYDESPYDALLDLYEPGLTSSVTDQVFGHMRTGIVNLLQEIDDNGTEIDDSLLNGEFCPTKQIALANSLVQWIGYDMSGGRQDQSAHPFSTRIGEGDVRITTRTESNNIRMTIFAALHEAGHAIHDQGVPRELSRSPLSSCESLSIAESQSRLWENLFGRSELVAPHLLRHLQSHFPVQFADVTPKELYLASNKVEPGYIRVNADEVTYGLHIILRFQIEKELIEGSLEVENLPDRWWSLMQDLLGLAPASDSSGVLQDVHWASGYFGYFPTYSLGTILSQQLFTKAISDIPEVITEMRAGQSYSLLDWMRNHVHIHGSKWSALQLVKHELSSQIDPAPYIQYLSKKYRSIYGIASK